MVDWSRRGFPPVFSPSSFHFPPLLVFWVSSRKIGVETREKRTGIDTHTRESERESIPVARGTFLRNVGKRFLFSYHYILRCGGILQCHEVLAVICVLDFKLSKKRAMTTLNTRSNWQRNHRKHSSIWLPRTRCEVCRRRACKASCSIESQPNAKTVALLLLFLLPLKAAAEAAAVVRGISCWAAPGQEEGCLLLLLRPCGISF